MICSGLTGLSSSPYRATKLTSPSKRCSGSDNRIAFICLDASIRREKSSATVKTSSIMSSWILPLCGTRTSSNRSPAIMLLVQTNRSISYREGPAESGKSLPGVLPNLIS
jgi:hypothetical protein